MRTDLFDFDLPADFIAQRPLMPRDASRLLVVGPELVDSRIRDLPQLLRPGDLLVFNDTRVIPTRLSGRRGTSEVEVTLHRRLDGARWQAFARPARRLNPGDRVEFAPGFAADVAAKGERGEVTLAFRLGNGELAAAMETHGRMPLPPYIKRSGGRDGSGVDLDRSDYQTLFAARDGAVAAPTAGLHFTPALMAALEAAGVAHTRVTLHVGAGTFLPVRAEQVEDHVMHPEWGEIGRESADAVNAARASGGRVVAVGSTSLRLLETAADGEGRVRRFAGETRIFITPGYRFRAVDLLLTNFHLPRSTLFMLVAAFASLERVKAAYEHAKKAGYRFYSYGDACLIHPAGRS